MNLTDEERREVLGAPTAKERKAIFNRLRAEHRLAEDEERYWDAVIGGLGRFRKELDR
jgi:hypothetical protein